MSKNIILKMKGTCYVICVNATQKLETQNKHKTNDFWEKQHVVFSLEYEIVRKKEFINESWTMFNRI